MKSVQYSYDVVVGSTGTKGQVVYTHSKREDARKELKEAKADGFDAYVVQHKFELVDSKKIR